LIEDSKKKGRYKPEKKAAHTGVKIHRVLSKKLVRKIRQSFREIIPRRQRRSQKEKCKNPEVSLMIRSGSLKESPLERQRK